jgi:hypothetical protein
MGPLTLSVISRIPKATLCLSLDHLTGSLHRAD